MNIDQARAEMRGKIAAMIRDREKNEHYEAEEATNLIYELSSVGTLGGFIKFLAELSWDASSICHFFSESLGLDLYKDHKDPEAAPWLFWKGVYAKIDDIRPNEFADAPDTYDT